MGQPYYPYGRFSMNKKNKNPMISDGNIQISLAGTIFKKITDDLLGCKRGSLVAINVCHGCCLIPNLNTINDFYSTAILIPYQFNVTVNKKRYIVHFHMTALQSAEGSDHYNLQYFLSRDSMCQL